MSISLDFDDELQRARFMQGVGAAPLEPIAIQPPKTLGLSSVSSIELAADSPVLEAPRQNMITRILKAHTRTEELTSEKSKLFENYVHKSFETTKEREQVKEETFLKEMEAAKGRDTWEAVSHMAQYIGCVATMTAAITLGWSLSGILLGAGAIAGGIIRVANDTHLLQAALEWYTKSRELQIELKRELEQCAFILQCGLGLAGGLAAWQAGFIAAFDAINVVDYTAKASNMISTTSTVMNVGGQVGRAYYNKHLSDYMADSRQLDHQIAEGRYAIGRETRDIQALLEDNESEVNQIRKAIQQQEVDFD